MYEKILKNIKKIKIKYIKDRPMCDLRYILNRNKIKKLN